MIYTDLEHAEELGKTLICVPIRMWKHYLEIREDYHKLKRQVTLREGKQ